MPEDYKMSEMDDLFKARHVESYESDDEIMQPIEPPTKKRKENDGEKSDNDDAIDVDSNEDSESDDDILARAAGKATKADDKEDTKRKRGPREKRRGKPSQASKLRRKAKKEEQKRLALGVTEKDALILDPNKIRALARKRVFVANVNFATEEIQLKSIFERECGDIQKVHYHTDALTQKFTGYCHIQFKTEEGAKNAVRKMHMKEVEDRYLYVEICNEVNLEGDEMIVLQFDQEGEGVPRATDEAAGKQDAVDNGTATNSTTAQLFQSYKRNRKKIHLPFEFLPSTLANRVSLQGKHPYFKMPDKMIEQMVERTRTCNYEGINISSIKDAWERTYNDGKKLDVSKWGFRNFSTAFKTFPQFRMERQQPIMRNTEPISGIKIRSDYEKSTMREEEKAEFVDYPGRAEVLAKYKHLHEKRDNTNTDMKVDVESKESREAGDGESKGESKVSPKRKQHKGSLTYVAWLR